MEFSRQEYWSGVPLPSPKNLLGFIKKIFSFIWLHQVVVVAHGTLQDLSLQLMGSLVVAQGLSSYGGWA